MAQLEGTSLGNYDLLERIGAGGMAEVYHARQRNAFGRDVAIKIIHRSFTEDEAFRARFLREGQATAHLTHPHILPLIEVGEEGDTLFLVMPYVAGGTLRDVLARTKGPLPIPLIAGYFSQLCEAVQYAHERGLVHRDIKPSNILLYNERHILLADFGIALGTQEARLTSTGLGLGTAEYMAPEQAHGFADTRSDLYSLGIVLFEMLTGHVPFTGRTAFDVFLQHTNAPIPALSAYLPAFPAELAGVDACLELALAKDPAQRFKNAVALNAAAQHALTASVPQAPANASLRPLRLQPAPQTQVIQGSLTANAPADQPAAVAHQEPEALGAAHLIATSAVPAREGAIPAVFDEEDDPSGERPTLAAAQFTRQSRSSDGYHAAARSPRSRARLLWLSTLLLLLALGAGTFAFANALFSGSGSQPQTAAGLPITRSTSTIQQTQQPSPTLIPTATSTPLPSPTATPLPGRLRVAPGTLIFFTTSKTCSATPSQTLTIQNTGIGPLTWQAEIQGKHLSITPISGKLAPNQGSSMKVSLSCSHILPQTIHDQILFTSNGGNVVVQVTIFVSLN